MKRIPPGKQLSSLNTSAWPETNYMSKQLSYFPRSITLKDIDEAVLNWFNSTEIRVENVADPVPAFFLTPEKWAEFKKEWKYMDDDRNVSYPFITIRRPHNPRPSQAPVTSRIPGKSFIAYRVPHYTPTGITEKLYKVPQPIKIELDYEIRCLTHYIVDINKINETLLRHFSNLQAYLQIDNHYMPMVIESVNDETDNDSADSERILHTLYSTTVYGYLIDETEFEEKIGVTDITVHIEENTD